MYSILEPTPAQLESILAEQRGEALTYAELGATTDTELPPGYRHDRCSAELGRGRDVFERGAEALRQWQAHAGAGVRVLPSGAPIEVGVEVVLCFRLVALHVVAACRIVRVVDEAARFGFAYGTLPMHPETGEEAFLVEWDEERDPSVRFSITAFSRPRERLAALAGPVSRRVQRRVTESYLEGVRRFVST